MLSRSLSVLALTLTALSAMGADVALGQHLSPFGTASEQPGELATPQGYSLIHVHGVGGSDTIGDGTQLRPYQTITHALEVATPGSIIILAPGEYTEASGETFPLRLQPGITVQGSPSPGSHQTVIRGSGIYQSTTEGYMQATVVGVDGAGLGHVTVTNPVSNGYGLVVEAGSPVIRGNAFVGSGYGGAYIAGPGTPVIESNLFRQNGVVGLVIAAQSTAQVQGNVFEDTGTGIRVAPGAQPQISNNRVVQNQQGIVLAADALPVLANNEIARNRQNGLVEFVATAKVDGSHPPTALLGQGRATASPFAADPIAPLSPPVNTTGEPSLAPPPTFTEPLSLGTPPAGRATSPVTVSPGNASGVSVQEVANVATATPAPAATPSLAEPISLLPPSPSGATRANLRPQDEETGATVETVADGSVLSSPPPTAIVVAPQWPADPPVLPATEEAIVVTDGVEPNPVAVSDGESATVADPLSARDTTAVMADPQEVAPATTPEEELVVATQAVVATEESVAVPSTAAISTPSPASSTLPDGLLLSLASQAASIEAAPAQLNANLAEEAGMTSLPVSSTLGASEAASVEAALALNIASSTTAVSPAATTAMPEPANAGQPDNLELSTVPQQAEQSVDAGERWGRIRQSLFSQAATTTDTAAIPLQVIPPPETLARAREDINIPEVAPDNADMSAMPTVEVAASQPAPAATLPNLNRLPVPEGNIPSRSQSRLPDLAAVPGLQQQVVADADAPPPPPPSLASMLGLVYKVFVPAVDSTIYDQVRVIAPDAFRVQVNGQAMIQAGAYPDRQTAEAKAAELAQVGLAAQVEYVP
jgi:hypothetical protein